MAAELYLNQKVRTPNGEGLVAGRIVEMHDSGALNPVEVTSILVSHVPPLAGAAGMWTLAAYPPEQVIPC
jgi:hypothetical protein